MVKLFKGYESASDKEFISHIHLKKDEYNEGGSIDANKLMKTWLLAGTRQLVYFCLLCLLCYLVPELFAIPAALWIICMTELYSLHPAPQQLQAGLVEDIWDYNVDTDMSSKAHHI